MSLLSFFAALCLIPLSNLKPKLHFDPKAAVAHLRASDAELAALIDRVGPFALELKPATSLFEALLRSIVYQQLHGKAAATIHGRVLAELEKHGGTTPEALAKATDAALRGAGLSGNKLLAVRDLAAKCREGTVPSLKQAARIGDDELVARLTEVRGIGPWTVNMLLIFHRSEEHTSELQSPDHLVCRLLLEKKKKNNEHK